MWLLKDDSFPGQLQFCMKAEESLCRSPYIYIYIYIYFGDTHKQNEDEDKALHILENTKRNVQKCATDDNKTATQNNCKKSYGLYYIHQNRFS